MSDLRDAERPLPQLEPVTIDGNPKATRGFAAMREIVQRLFSEKSPLPERAVRWKDLWEQGVIGFPGKGFNQRPRGDVLPPAVSPGGSDYNPDYSIPPAPTGLTATGGFAVVFLEWAPAAFAYYGQTEIWRAATNNLGAAALVGTSVASLYADAIGATGATYYYWVRFVNKWDNTIKGPFNAASGVAGTVSTDPAYVLQVLANQISKTQLATALRGEIDLITAPATQIGSVRQIVQDGDNALAAQIASITASGNGAFDAFKQWPFDSSGEGWTITNATLTSGSGWISYTSPTATVSLTSPAISPAVDGRAYQQVKFRASRVSGTGWGVTLRWRRGATWYSVAMPDPAIGAGETKVALAELSANANWTAGGVDQIELTIPQTEVFSFDWIAIGRDGPGASYAALQEEKQARLDGDSANASSISTLTATVNGKADSAALSTEASVRATETGYLASLYTVRAQITQDGRAVVGGFGLSGTSSPTAGPTIDFGVAANRFWVGAPSGTTGAADIQPFVIQTTPTTINGQSVPVGVYMSGAFIQNGTVTNLTVGKGQIDDGHVLNLSAVKLTAGDGTIGNVLKSENFVSGSAGWIVRRDGTAEFGAAMIRGRLTAAQIDSRGLTIQDASGNILFGSGTNLDWSRISGQPASIDNNNIRINGGLLEGIGAGNGTAVANSNIGISNGVISGIGTGNGTEVGNSLLVPSINAAAQTAQWTSVGGKPYFGGFSGIDQINSGNISTYIAGAAIDLARINTATIWSLSALSATVGVLRTASSGARVEIKDNLIEVFYWNNARAVRIAS